MLPQWSWQKGGLEPMSPAELLTLTQRFLATGESFRSLSFQFRISKSAISYIVQKVCRAIIPNLACTYLKVTSMKSQWMKIAKQFYDCWNFQMLSVHQQKACWWRFVLR